MKQQTMNGKWSWRGHTLSERRDRPHNSCRRDTDRIVEAKGYSWTLMEHLAWDRMGDWRIIVDGRYSKLK